MEATWTRITPFSAGSRMSASPCVWESRKTATPGTRCTCLTVRNGSHSIHVWRLAVGQTNGSFPSGYAFAALFRLRVAAAFLAEAERSAAGRAAEADPPFLLDTWVSGTSRPLPDLLPPPDSLLTVAQARD